MNVTLVRNATMVLELAERRILVDPMLDPAGARPLIEQTASPVRNPTVELPFPAEMVVSGLDAVLVTQCHKGRLRRDGGAAPAARRARVLPAGGRGAATGGRVEETIETVEV